jgi:hypothetical protein
MNHREHYKPEPVANGEPSPLAIIGGAVVFAAAVYLLTFLAFIL